MDYIAEPLDSASTFISCVVTGCLALIALRHSKQLPPPYLTLSSQPISMASQGVAEEYAGVSKLAKYPFEPYWPEKNLRVCITGAGGFIASHLAKRLKSEGHYVIACDWKRNEHFSVSSGRLCRVALRTQP